MALFARPSTTSARAPMLGTLVLVAGFMGPLAGCGDDAPDRDPDAAPDADGSTILDDATDLVASRVVLDVSGDTDIEFDEIVDLTVTQLDGDDGLRLLSVGLRDPVDVGEAQMRVAFDLAGVYGGDGDYELPAVGRSGTPASDDAADDVAATTAGLSGVSFAWSPLGDLSTPGAADEFRSYDIVLSPCQVAVDDDARSGSLVCDELGDGGNRTISITMTWDPA